MQVVSEIFENFHFISSSDGPLVRVVSGKWVNGMERGGGFREYMDAMESRHHDLQALFCHPRTRSLAASAPHCTIHHQGSPERHTESSSSGKCHVRNLHCVKGYQQSSP